MRLLSWGNYRRLPPLDSAVVRRQVGDATVDRILDLDERLCAKARAYAAHWNDDYNCTAVAGRRIDAEIVQSIVDEERRQWRKALVALWRAPPNRGQGLKMGHDDGFEDVGRTRRFGLRLLCTATMLLGRSPVRHNRIRSFGRWNSRWSGLNAVNLVFWDNQSDGYGWSAQILEFHPWQFRYSLISDGDCTM